jgi:NTP pyrophosphatase (non-canonical NTP hydrolase)
MNFTDYQIGVMRTANSNLDDKDELLNAALGIGGESGEFLEIVKKHYFHGKELDQDKAAKELGDILYYVAWASDRLGFLLEEIAQRNIDKLKERYPQGFVAGGGIRSDEGKNPS